jgi:excisionase family DNA binding protein
VSAPLLTPREAAQLLGVSAAFVYRHARELGGAKFGSLIRFSQEGIDAYHQTHRIPAPTIPLARTEGCGSFEHLRRLAERRRKEGKR